MLLFVCLGHCVVSRASMIYRDGDEPTKPKAVVVFTLLLSKFRV